MDDIANRDLISKKTRIEFREYLVRWTLREIEIEFDSAYIDCDVDYEPNISGQRRSLVEQYYHGIDFSSWSDVQKVLKVYENILNHIEDNPEHSYGGASNDEENKTLLRFVRWLKKDGFDYSNGKIVSFGGHSPEIIKVIPRFDAPELHRQIDRLKNSIDSDPALAIGTAKEIIETTCKTILSEREIEVGNKKDMPALIKEVRKELKLLPEDIPNTVRGEKTIKRLLSSMGTIAECLGELRNLYGTGHGRKGKTKGINARHARLAVGAASTLATYLLETHLERQ